MEKKLGLRSWAEVSIVVWDRNRWKKLIFPIPHGEREGTDVENPFFFLFFNCFVG